VLDGASPPPPQDQGAAGEHRRQQGFQHDAARLHDLLAQAHEIHRCLLVILFNDFNGRRSNCNLVSV
jgi:hypothetical protein